MSAHRYGTGFSQINGFLMITAGLGIFYLGIVTAGVVVLSLAFALTRYYGVISPVWLLTLLIFAGSVIPTRAIYRAAAKLEEKGSDCLYLIFMIIGFITLPAAIVVLIFTRHKP